MTPPPESVTRPPPRLGVAGRIVVALALAAAIFVLLWITVFSMLTSVLIGSGALVVLVAASTISHAVEMILDVIASVVLGVLAAIAAVVGAIFGLFGN